MRLRHVARPVHFPLVVDLQFNLDALVLGNANATLSRSGLARTAISSVDLLLVPHLVETLLVLSRVLG